MALAANKVWIDQIHHGVSEPEAPLSGCARSAGDRRLEVAAERARGMREAAERAEEAEGGRGKREEGDDEDDDANERGEL